MRSNAVLAVVLIGAMSGTTGGESGELDPFADAVSRYFEMLSAGRFEDAYEMLSQCEVQLHSASRSGVAYHRRPPYENWIGSQRGLVGLEITRLWRHTTADPDRFSAAAGDAEATLGIRVYCLTYRVGGARQMRCASTVRGTDDRIRVLGIGSGP